MRQIRDPLPFVLVVLTVVAGLVDAISFLGIAHVLTAIMTGNIVILGFAIAGAEDFSATAALVSLTAFLFGASFGGRLFITVPDRRRRVKYSLAIEAALLAVAALGAGVLDPSSLHVAHGLIGVLGAAMGMRNAVVAQLGIPEASTTVLTLTVARLAADSPFGTGRNVRFASRLSRTIALLAGAILGTLLLRHLGLFPAIATAAAAVALVAGVYTLYPGMDDASGPSSGS